MTRRNRKILMISSPGGHWVQLNRMLPAIDLEELVLASPYEKTEVDCLRYYKIIDINRNNLIKLPLLFILLVKIFLCERPDCFITTGALPGLIGVFIGRIFGVQTIWVDSIANSEKISLSGRIATHISSHAFTQWESLSNDKIKYIGKVV